MVRRSQLRVLAPMTLVLLTSCAAHAEGPGPSAGSLASSPGVVAQAECESAGSGFALSLAADAGGQATPLAAVVHFGKQGGERDYRASADKWAQVPNQSDGEGQSVDGVTLRTGGVFLHVIQLEDDSWAVDSGGHCAN